MRDLLITIAGLVIMAGTCYVPPWDMPADAVRNEPLTEAYAEEIDEAEEVIAEEIIEAETAVQEPEMEYLGTFEMTAYEWTGNPCANGCYPTEGYTVACNSLPLGTTVYIEGVGYRVVEDRGAEWHSSTWMDLYLGDVDACYQWGIRSVEVYIVR